MAKRETIDGFRGQRRNANKHTQRGIGMLQRAMETSGYVAPMTAAADGEIIDGSARLDVAADVFDGVDPLVVDHDGTRPIIMRRTDIPNADDPRAVRISLEANRIAAADLEWDAAILGELAADDPAMLAGLWNDDELAEVLAGIEDDEAAGTGDAEPQVDRAAELAEQWGTKAGQVWALGNHRLAVGDCTDAGVVAALLAGDEPSLMVTDPPYGVEYDPNWRNEAADKGLIAHADRRVGNVTNDDRVDWRSAWALFPGDVAYCWHAGRHASAVQESLAAADFDVRCQVVWAKSRFAISRGHYHWQHEPCWYAVRKGATAGWVGDRSQTTLWEIELDPNADGGHSTQKPIECMRRPIRNHEGDVYDPFVGSGTTIIACEQLGRRCYAVEIDPGYAAVAIQRWVDVTGGEPRIVVGAPS